MVVPTATKGIIMNEYVTVRISYDLVVRSEVVERARELVTLSDERDLADDEQIEADAICEDVEDAIHTISYYLHDLAHAAIVDE